MTKHCVVVLFFLTYACTRAHSNSDIDFLLSQVSHKEKNSEKKQLEIQSKRRKIPEERTQNTHFALHFQVDFRGTTSPFVKTHSQLHSNEQNFNTLPPTLWHLWQQKDKNSCNTRVRVRARMIICIFTFPQTQFLISVSPSFFLRFPSCIKNEPSLSTKWHVVFTKTSRRFHQNNTLFSSKHHVTF